MASFDGWESQYLDHSGIKGMKWGVRRYQNEDGSLTEAGKQRYGFGKGEGLKRTSARKMTKDFNKLDRGYANVVASQRHNAKETAKLARKMHKAERKGNTDKAAKLKKKAMAVAEKAALNNKQMKAIESLQWKIIGKAATKGYTTNAAGVVRTGKAVGARSSKQQVSGQEIKITRRGDGRTHVINYNEGKKYEQEQRAREAAERRKKYYNR